MRADRPRAILAVDDAVKIFNRALYCAIGAPTGGECHFSRGTTLAVGQDYCDTAFISQAYAHQAHGKFNAAYPSPGEQKTMARGVVLMNSHFKASVKSAIL